MPTARLIVADPDGREMMISCGAELLNVRLALRSLGYDPRVLRLPDPDQPTLVARVSWRQRAAADEFERRLFGCCFAADHRGASRSGAVATGHVAGAAHRRRAGPADAQHGNIGPRPRVAGLLAHGR